MAPEIMEKYEKYLADENWSDSKDLGPVDSIYSQNSLDGKEDDPENSAFKGDIFSLGLSIL